MRMSARKYNEDLKTLKSICSQKARNIRRLIDVGHAQIAIREAFVCARR